MRYERIWSFGRKEVEKICADALKDVNEGCLKAEANFYTSACFQVLFNILRKTEVFYKHSLDEYTKSSIMKDHIISLLIEKIEI